MRRVDPSESITIWTFLNQLSPKVRREWSLYPQSSSRCLRFWLWWPGISKWLKARWVTIGTSIYVPDGEYKEVNKWLDDGAPVCHKSQPKLRALAQELAVLELWNSWGGLAILGASRRRRKLLRAYPTL